MNTTTKSLLWIVAVLGIWEIAAPFVLGYSATAAAMWNAVVIGVVVLVLAAWAALANDAGMGRTLGWVNAVLGVWLVIAPFILSYSSLAAAMWNDVIAGVIVACVAAWAAVSLGGSAATPQTH